MHTPDGAHDRAVWLPTQEVAGAIWRAADAFSSGKGAVSVEGRGERPVLRGTKVAICDDTPLFLLGIEQAVKDLGMAVTQRIVDAPALEHGTLRDGVEVLIIDVAQPPTFTVEGILAAQRIREARPGLPTLLLSTDVGVEGECAMAALQSDFRALGYLDKNRLAGGSLLASALTRILHGGTVVDPEVVSRLMAAHHDGSVLDALSARECETLELVAQGLTNAAIARSMFLSPKTVEANIASLFTKLGLPVESTANRRVLATLTYLKAARSSHAGAHGFRTPEPVHGRVAH